VVTENDIDKLCGAVKELVLNETERIQIAQTAIKIAEEKFSADTVRSQFRNVIDSVADKSN